MRAVMHRSKDTVATIAVAVALIFAGVSCKKSSESPAPPLRVAAAADLALAFKDVGETFESSFGKHVDFTFGSSGMLAKQIAEGAPYDVFASADRRFVDEVVEKGACIGETRRLYARGRIVLWARSAETLPGSLEDLRAAKYAKIAVANPEHAPYGRAAKEALEHAGVWADVQPRLVFGENIQQTMAFAESGNAEVAIVALSLTANGKGVTQAIGDDLYTPLDQAMVVCKGGSRNAPSEDALAFVSFLGAERGHAILGKYGFVPPSEAGTR